MVVRERWLALMPMFAALRKSGPGPGCVKTLRGIAAPRILRLVVTLRAKKCKNSSFARHYDQIRFRFRTAWTLSSHRRARLAAQLITRVELLRRPTLTGCRRPWCRAAAIHQLRRSWWRP